MIKQLFFQNKEEFTELVNIIKENEVYMPLISNDDMIKQAMVIGIDCVQYHRMKFIDENTITRNNLKVITVSKFKEELNKMKDEFENGELIEVSDNKVRWYEKIYIGRNSNSPTLLSYVSSDSEGHVSSWRYARKIQPVEEMTMGEVCKALGKTIKIVP